MAVTLTELAGALRLGDGETLPVEPVAGILERLKAAGSSLIATVSPDAPDTIKDEALVRFVAYIYDSPNASPGDGYASAWRNSGAESLVSRWVVRRGVGASAGGFSTGFSSGYNVVRDL